VQTQAQPQGQAQGQGQGMGSAVKGNSEAGKRRITSLKIFYKIKNLSKL
jgi:hypothetical protein